MAIIGTPAKRYDKQHALNDGNIEEIETWQVITDGTSTLRSIRDASPIPEYWSKHPDNSLLYVSSKRVRPAGNGGDVYHVEVSYSGSVSGQIVPDNPIERAPDIEWGTIETVENIDTDVSGNATQNLVGEDFDPPITAMRGYTQLVVSRNELISEFNAAKADSFKYHVNSGVFFGAPPGAVLCKSISAKRVTTSTMPHWRTTYEFIFKMYQGTIHRGYSGPWAARIANKGKRQPKLTPQSGVLAWESIKDANGDPITEPVCLGLDGLPTSQQVGSIPTIWLGFQIYPEANFAALGLE